MSAHLPVLVIVHQKTSTPGLVGDLLCALGFTLDLRCPAMAHPLPDTLDHHSGVVIFGGPMSANDDHIAFIRQELDWIPTVLAAGKPYLGICLGAQLLARALGARVAPHPAGQREIGYYPIVPTTLGQELLPTPLMVYQWHQEGFDLPWGSQLLATGQTFPHQVFRYGQRAYGLQFHPEITTAMVNHWTTEGADQLTCPGAQGRGHHLSQHRLYGPAIESWLGQFLADWLGVTAQIPGTQGQELSDPFAVGAVEAGFADAAAAAALFNLINPLAEPGPPPAG
ncbi:glutamine amidotransferase [Nodosilinea sp. LEGE 07088]|uniref:glutamine amidotransferase-related protein n=1 Tax=Nodosilinea sp. LEGE 07088 TaxID=2777968 RepID=UPI001880AE64|nr:glutamine amidotransferase [Nodosilinea sp. LEGE 07088]MBE9136114.1 glutamine amidotransferase [Nodosilinea sp. LEGE 07088]